MDDENLKFYIPDNVWDSFVYSHQRGNIFQTSALYHVYNQTKNYQPIKVAICDQNTQKIKGIMTGVIIREMKGIIGDFSARSIVQGGPLTLPIADMETVNELVQKYDAVAGNSALFTEIRNMFDLGPGLKIDNYNFINHLNFLIDLRQSDDELWQQIHKSRRKNITRAKKTGLFVEEINNLNKISVFYSLIVETYKKVKIPVPDISLFETAYRLLVPCGFAKFFLAYNNDECIGARAILLYKDRIYDWYAGASPGAKFQYPNDFLVWHILQWGVKNKYSVFDFGGAGTPDKPYGPREFKRRFGGELVNYGRYIRNYSPGKIKFAQFGFKIYRKLLL